MLNHNFEKQYGYHLTDGSFKGYPMAVLAIQDAFKITETEMAIKQEDVRLLILSDNCTAEYKCTGYVNALIYDVLSDYNFSIFWKTPMHGRLF